LVLAENIVGSIGAASLAEAVPYVKELILYDTSLGSAGAMQLASAVSDSALEVLDICHNNIEDVGAKSLAQSLKKPSCHLTWLSLTSNSIGEDGIEEIANSIASNKNLRELRLSRNFPGLSGLTALAKSLQNNATLKVLALKSSSLGNEGAAILGNRLPDMAGIEHICLQHNAIGDEGMETLAQGLRINSSVIAIELEKNFLGNAGSIAIADVLNCRADFQRLLLGRNQIEDEGVRELAKAVKKHRSLLEIDLHRNKFEWDGIELAKAISENEVIQSVVLNCNTIYIQGAEEFAAAAKKRQGASRSLRLDISNCYIGTQGAVALGAMLGTNPNLLILEIASNELGDTGAKHIARALKRNRELETLNLRDNRIKDDGAEALAEALPGTCIQFIDIDENLIEDSGATYLSQAVTNMKDLGEMRLRKNEITQKGYDQLKKASWSSALKFAKSPPKIRVSAMSGFRMCGLSVDDAKGMTSLRHAWELVNDLPETSMGLYRDDSDSEPDLQCLTSQQRKHIKNLLPGASKHDPAQNPQALRDCKHLLRKVDVRLLRQSHDTVSSVFSHGPHKGEPVDNLLADLHKGKRLDEITPLVVVTSRGQHWVVFGNRRLKCLQEYASQVHPRLVEMQCIVHNFDSDAPVDKSLLAKFLDSATTESNGASASFRSGNADPKSHRFRSPESEKIGIMSAEDGRPKCFVECTLLEDLEQRYVRVDRLKEDDHVLGDGLLAVRIVSRQVHSNVKQKLIEIEAGDAKLTVTSSHRVMVKRHSAEAAPANSLRVGDDVLCRGRGFQKVTHVRAFDANVSVVELEFSPDIPVAAFLEPHSMIMTKGRGRGKWRSRGKGKGKGDKSYQAPNAEDTSIPDTDWTYSAHKRR